MEMTELFKIWDRFDRSDLNEFHLEQGGSSLLLRRGVCGVSAEAGSTYSSGNISKSGEKESLVWADKEVQAENLSDNRKSTGTESLQIKGVAVTTPVVGVFYRAPAPDADPFITIGSQVKKGDVIGIVEAMKMMNEITATEDGTILSVEAEDGELVEFGQVLVRIGG